MYSNYSNYASGSGGHSHRPQASSQPQQFRRQLVRHNSDWDVSRQSQSADAQARANLGSRTSAAAIQLETNRIYGARYEDHVERALTRDPRYSHVTDQVRLVPKPSGTPYSTQELKDLNGQRGATLRSDFVAYKKNEGYQNVECKSSSTAGYTSNQSAMISDIDRKGAVVVSGRGNYYRGQDLGSVSTVTVRPHTEDRIFTQEIRVPVGPPRVEDPIWGRR